MRISFVYSGGRAERLQQAERHEVPDEFFYGLPHFLRAGCDVMLLEETGRSPTGLRDRAVFARSKMLARFAIGYRVPGVARLLPKLQDFDWIVGIPDSIALALAYYARAERLPGRVCYVAMGLAARLDAHRGSPLFTLLLRHYRPLLAQCASIVCLGAGEMDFFTRTFSDLGSRLVLIPFGVDCEFWTPGAGYSPNEPKTVLFVGNDRNRDFALLVRIAEALPTVRFQFITNQMNAHRIPPNVEVVRGEWRRPALDDAGVREAYRRARCVVLPLKDSLQPSGQSVALQAMACGTPVAITRTRGFWSPGEFRDGEHCLFVEPGDLGGWVRAIRSLLENDVLCRKLSSSASDLVKNGYTSGRFARRLGETLGCPEAVAV